MGKAGSTKEIARPGYGSPVIQLTELSGRMDRTYTWQSPAGRRLPGRGTCFTDQVGVLKGPGYAIFSDGGARRLNASDQG